jgi:hypothetical protein
MLRRLLAGALALAFSIGFVVNGASAQTGQGVSPLTGSKGGTNNGFMQFSGPAATMKTYVLPNLSGTLATLEAVQTWTGAQSFADGKLILLGATSGSTTLKAPATGGGTATLFPGTDTVTGIAATQTLTNKTLDGASNTFSNIPFGAVTGTLPVSKGGTGIASVAQHDIVIGTAANTLTPKSLPDCPDVGGKHLNYVSATQDLRCGTSGDGIGGGGGGSVGPGMPQARLTLTQGTPVTGTDVTASSSLYLEPYEGNQVAVYDGVSAWLNLTVASATYLLPATQAQTCTLNGTITVTGCTDTSQMTIGQQVTGSGITGTGTIAAIPNNNSFTLGVAASGSGAQSLTFKLPPSTNYDVYIISNGGAPKLIWSLPWSDDTTPPARDLQDGVEVSSGARTKRLMGSVRTTVVAGRLEDSHTHRWLSNRYKEQPRLMYASDPQATWPGVVSATFSWNLANLNPFNVLDFLACVERPVWVQSQSTVVASAGAGVTVGIGIDTTGSSTAQFHQQASVPTSITNSSFQTSATYMGTPGLGRHIAAWLQSSWTAPGVIWIGSSSPNTQVSGIYGEIAN